MNKNNHVLVDRIIFWFRNNRRYFPWRINRNWYKVWISEVMLQQTQAEQIINYYNRFLKRFPTVTKLANANLQEVLKLWEGLGYYSRARNLHKSAKIIVENFDRTIPDDIHKISQLPGIGEYTSHAILSIVYNKHLSVVDGNVIRVITRIYNITDDIRLPKSKRMIKNKMDYLLPHNNPGEFNEAVMELGATVCFPGKPKCISCPVSEFCYAFSNDLTKKLPFKPPRPDKPVRNGFMQIIRHKKKLLIVKRKENGLLGGFWEFPYKAIEINGDLSLKQINNLSDSIFIEGSIQQIWKPVKHTYSHFHLNLYPIHIDEKAKIIAEDMYDELIWISTSELSLYPLHKAMQKVVEKALPDLKIISQR